VVADAIALRLADDIEADQLIVAAKSLIVDILEYKAV
jgi:hypothetical protein